jgi:hypothetical protein
MIETEHYTLLCGYELQELYKQCLEEAMRLAPARGESCLDYAWHLLACKVVVLPERGRGPAPLEIAFV